MIYPLSVRQIIKINHVLTFSNQADVDGNKVKKTYATDEVCAINRFRKNTKDILEKYDDLVASLKEKARKKWEKKYANKQENALEKNQIYMESQITEQLNKDKDLNIEYGEKKYEIDIPEKTEEVIRNSFRMHRFEADDQVSVDLLEIFDVGGAK